MATTTNADIDVNVPELWARDTLSDSLEGAFWTPFTGPVGSGMPIIQKTELLNKAGDLIHITVTGPLAGAGVSGDETALEGSEEALSLSEIKCATTLFRHAVRTYRRADRKALLDLRNEAKLRLAEWGREKMDDIRFARYAATSLASPLNGETYNAPNVYVSGHLSALTDMTTNGNGNLVVEDIQRLKVQARIQRMKPVMQDGKPFYALVTHPYALFNLKREDEYRDWVREAHVRGERNPFFTGATAVIDGVVIYDHPNVTTVSSGHGTPETAAVGLFFGAEAFVEALDESVTWVERDFDYANQYGIAYSFAFDTRRALELSSIKTYSAAPTI